MNRREGQSCSAPQLAPLTVAVTSFTVGRPSSRALKARLRYMYKLEHGVVGEVYYDLRLDDMSISIIHCGDGVLPLAAGFSLDAPKHNQRDRNGAPPHVRIDTCSCHSSTLAEALATAAACSHHAVGGR